MKRHLKEQIISLKRDGKTIKEIQSILHCSSSTVAYHLYDKTKIATIQRIDKNYKKKYAKSPNAILYQKYEQFFRIGHTRKITSEKLFSFTELKSWIKIQLPICYLSGLPLDFNRTDGFSFDHILPVSKGGTNTLKNLGLCHPTINRMKTDCQLTEFFTFCRLILNHNP